MSNPSSTGRLANDSAILLHDDGNRQHRPRGRMREENLTDRMNRIQALAPLLGVNIGQSCIKCGDLRGEQHIRNYATCKAMCTLCLSKHIGICSLISDEQYKDIFTAEWWNTNGSANSTSSSTTGQRGTKRSAGESQSTESKKLKDNRISRPELYGSFRPGFGRPESHSDRPASSYVPHFADVPYDRAGYDDDRYDPDHNPYHHRGYDSAGYAYGRPSPPSSHMKSQYSNEYYSPVQPSLPPPPPRRVIPAYKQQSNDRPGNQMIPSSEWAGSREKKHDKQPLAQAADTQVTKPLSARALSMKLRREADEEQGQCELARKASENRDMVGVDTTSTEQLTREVAELKARCEQFQMDKTLLQEEIARLQEENTWLKEKDYGTRTSRWGRQRPS